MTPLAIGLLVLGTAIAIPARRIVRGLGRLPSGARRERIMRSPNVVAGRFVNALAVRHAVTMSGVLKWLFGAAQRKPTDSIPVVSPTAASLASASRDLRVTWLGHATVLVELEERRLLVDPVLLGDRAGPGPLGMSRFFAPPLEPAALPPLDAVLVTHDHFDHLGEQSARALASIVPRWITPLGVGAHLEAWGVPTDRITELDWWEETQLAGLRVACTPARHFSGRAPWGRDRTLWGGFVVLGERRRLFVCGDSGMTPEFEEIGRRYGPFDASLVEIGAYDGTWPDVHFGPEQAVAAHRMARGGLLVPVHWATFDLALHGWTEPAERLIVAAQAAGVSFTVPRPGQSVDVASPPPLERWWPMLPWQTAEQGPVVSTGL